MAASIRSSKIERNEAEVKNFFKVSLKKFEVREDIYIEGVRSAREGQSE
jgi:hypothetical protein